MTLLSSQKLHDKNIPGIERVLTLGFEYLITRISIEYSKINEYKTISEFNDKNKLAFSKILLYPFFVSLSNGHSESLYSLFGDFYSLSFGPISLHIFNLLKEDNHNHNITYFKIKANQTGIEANITEGEEATEPISFLEKTLERIKTTSIPFAEGAQTFDSLRIKSDSGKEKGLYEAIESGINAINTQSKNTFFKADTDIIKLHASYFDAFKSLYANNIVSKIKYDDVKSTKGRPFYVDEI